ncbi:skin secretory protein xP2-like [Poecile atricapillus]|uniref:skin secretory protein xP2-like n=1 Tax=Poecile atricapillus TaxID=48891 RepID=UPI002738EDE6|nr:skin secretory protein xP2-like [Poecile atricapillus]
MVVAYDSHLALLLQIWWQCDRTLNSCASPSAGSVAAFSNLDERDGSDSSCGSRAELSLSPGDTEPGGSCVSGSEVSSPKVAGSPGGLDPGQQAVGGTAELMGMTPPRPASQLHKPGAGSPPLCAFPVQTDEGLPERGAVRPLREASGTVPCPCCGWAVPYPAMGDRTGPSSVLVAAHTHAVPVEEGSALLRTERPAPILGFCAPKETLLGAIPSAAPPAPDLWGVGTGAASGANAGPASLPVPWSLPALGVGHSELAPPHPTSGSWTLPKPAAREGAPLPPPMAAADWGPALFTIGSGGDAVGAKPVASTGKGSQAAGASRAGLWTLPPCQMTVQPQDKAQFWGTVKAKVDEVAGCDSGHSPLDSGDGSSGSAGVTAAVAPDAVVGSSGKVPGPVLGDSVRQDAASESNIKRCNLCIQ